LALLGRALRYVAPFKARFLGKYLLTVLSLLPLVILPWPVKIVVDHVVDGLAIGAQPVPYPAFLEPAMALLDGSTPAQILIAMMAFQLVLVVLVGAVGTGGNERDSADAYLASGHDQATRTENEANAGFSLASGLLGLFDFSYTIRLTQQVNHHYRSRLFGRIQSLPMTVFDDESIGDAVFRVMYDTPAITSGVYRILLTPFASLAFGAVVIAALQVFFGSHPILWQSGLALLGISFLVSLPFAGLMRRRSLETRRAGASATASLEEGLHNIVAVQSLGAEGKQAGRFDRDSWASFSAYRGLMAVGMGIFLLGAIPALLVLANVGLYITDLVIAGTISRGDFSLLFAYFVMLCGAAIEVGALWIRVQESAAGLGRVSFLMDLPSEEDPPDAVPCPTLRETARIADVHFDYPDGTAALRGVDLELKVGEVTALVGPAGAGKTTLAYLFPGFVHPTSGRVLFDGSSLASTSLASRRAQVAFVFQETQLFDATVEENIRVGRPDATDAEVRRAARAAGADAFVQELPKGYRTPLGRGGGRLSVGQKQRLAIARALVRDARLLILDEPTSALDPETEQQLVDSLREAGRERAVLVIAHRLSTIRHADRIVFVEAGTVVEEGGHDALMARPGGAYRQFVELQSRGAA
jgi:ABC-type multidrug transport system fused ATPase/permease subunit